MVMLVQSLQTCCHRLRRIFLNQVTVRMLAIDSKRPDHLERTADNSRSEVESGAVVTKIVDLSSTVKNVTLEVKNKALNFLPGQWVDFFIPGVPTVGGFSMASAPHHLHTHHQLDLAIKYSTHPPAHWVHTQCQVGSEVNLRVGGDFFYSPAGGAEAHSLLLVAGGVGINPLFSILQHAAYLRVTAGVNVKASLLFSAKLREDLIFYDHIKRIADQNEGFQCKFFLTNDETSTNDSSVQNTRIDQASLAVAIQHLSSGSTPITSYLCGPGPMIDAMESELLNIGMQKSAILYEKWW